MTNDPRTVAGALSPTELVGLEPVCDRFEAAWRAGRRPRIEDYLGDVPAPSRPALLRELLELECDYRHRLGECPPAEEYCRRFPQEATAVQEAFAAPHPSRRRPGPSPEAEEAGVAYNLLFGVLALHMDLIAREPLVAATRTWVLDKRKPLAQVLVEQGALPAKHRALLEPLVQAHVQRHGGDPQASLATLSSLASVREELAATADLAVQTSLARIAAPRPTDEDPADAAGAATSSGTRFRILRPHAQGGLGEVYLARDEELHREVALKQIRREHADDRDSRARFLLEAVVTGRLEHPGIIPVYGLGHYADGRPFYAMRFIQGDSLKDAIEHFHRDDGPGRDPGERVLAFRELLGRFVDVCNALAYAHSRGVLHRDLKPGNVLLGPYGETLLVDWGLAKLVAPPETKDAAGQAMLPPGAAGDLAPTLVGSALGTPAYMSPEQAAGALDRLGPASDVYSLGATLYGLLTGRAPFEGRDVDVMLWAVLRGDFPPPRAVHRAVPAALEAICLKAMALRPEDRYPSARALAEDVNRWLGDEPVSAWLEPAVARAARWARRHRPLVTGVVVALAAAVAALALGTVLIGRQKQRAERNAWEAQRNLALARQVVEEMYSRVADELGSQKGMDRRQQDLLEKALRFYERDQLRQSGDPEVRHEAGRAALRVGDIRQRLGQVREAEAAYGRALQILEPLAAQHPGRPDFRRTLAVAYHNRGRYVDFPIGRRAEAEARLKQALAIAEDLAARYPGVAEYRNDLALDLHDLGTFVYLPTGRFADFEAVLKRSLAITEALATAYPDVPEYRFNVAKRCHDLAVGYRGTERLDEADTALKRGLAILEPLAAGHPEVAEYQRFLGVTLYELGLVYASTLRAAEAEAAWQRSFTALDKLAADHPDVVLYQDHLARQWLALGALYSDLLNGRQAEAEKALSQGAALYERLARDHPDVPDYRANVAMARGMLGSHYGDAGRVTDAEAAYRQAVAVWEELAADHPDVPVYRSFVANELARLGFVVSARGRDAEAEAAYRRAVGIQEKLVAEHPEVARYQDNLADNLGAVGRLGGRLGRTAEAERAYRRAVAIRERLAADHHELVDYAIKLATDGYFKLGEHLRQRGEPGAARPWFERAVGSLTAVLKRRPHPDADRPYLLSAYLGWAAAAAALGRPADVLAARDEAEAAGLTGAASSAGPPATVYNLACLESLASAAALRDVGRPPAECTTLARRRAEDAIAALRRAIAAGYRDAAKLAKDRDLDPLRERADFQALLMDQAFPDDPFRR
jgi:serine/threonine-protein kinase